MIQHYRIHGTLSSSLRVPRKEKIVLSVYMLATFHSTITWVYWWCLLLCYWVLVPWICLPLVSGHLRVRANNLNSVVLWGLSFHIIPALYWRLWHAWCYQYIWLGVLNIQRQYCIDDVSSLTGILRVRSLVVTRSCAWCCPSICYFDCLGTVVHCMPTVNPPAGWHAEPLCHFGKTNAAAPELDRTIPSAGGCHGIFYCLQYKL